MPILRMLSGLLAGAQGLLKPGRREKNRAAKPGFGPEPAARIAAAADFHARAARRSVEDLDGEGALAHMRHFRRYSGALARPDEPFGRGPALRLGACAGCGSTCARRDMTATCFACDPGHRRSRPSWTARDGRRIPVEEMGDDHLTDSARMVRRWLRRGDPVSDDRIRMCGHVLAECRRRGITGEVGRG